MRRIVGIGNQEKVWDLRDTLSAYLTPFAYPWLTLCGLDDQPTERICLAAEQREGLKDVLVDALRYLVNRLYTKPSERQLSIHRSSFERIELDGQSYLVNYRTSEPGGLMFALFTFTESVGKDSEVVITLAPLPLG